MLTETQRRLKYDFPFFAEHNLKIRDKSGLLIPFKLNKAQRYLQFRTEDQIRRTGKVRLAVLKGRQQGLSTFIGGYLYHRTVALRGLLTFIFAHDADGSGSLYKMVQTFYAESMYEDTKPTLGSASQRELSFPSRDSGYKVGTAGTVGLGRSKTIQQLHWSEVAYSPNCEDHAKGIMQAVPDLDGTAIFLESTSNGQGDFFHRTCMQAISGQGDFELVFIPWYWQEEYARDIPEGWELEELEQELLDAHGQDGLTERHLVWRRHKIATDFQQQVSLFKREYPFTPSEAFEANDEESFIKATWVRRARTTKPIDTDAPLIFGVDPARLGGDKFRICHRRGRNVEQLYTLPAGDIEHSVNLLQKEINKYSPALVNIDCGGLGVAVYDRLRSMGNGGIIRKVDFGGSAINSDRYRNKRAEMYGTAREWLLDEPCSISLDEKTADMLQAELSIVKPKWVNNSQLLMQPKEEIKKELGYSPDTADAFALTFAQALAKTATQAGMESRYKVTNRKVLTTTGNIHRNKVKLGRTS